MEATCKFQKRMPMRTTTATRNRTFLSGLMVIQVYEAQKQSELELELLSNSCESPAYGMPYHRR